MTRLQSNCLLTLCSLAGASAIHGSSPPFSPRASLTHPRSFWVRPARCSSPRSVRRPTRAASPSSLTGRGRAPTWRIRKACRHHPRLRAPLRFRPERRPHPSRLHPKAHRPRHALRGQHRHARQRRGRQGHRQRALLLPLPSQPQHHNAGLNSLVQIDLPSGRYRTITRFANQTNYGGFGPPTAEAVPDRVRP
jgi:hypothetical protein